MNTPVAVADDIVIQHPSEATGEGSFFLVMVKSKSPISEVTGRFQNHDVVFFPDGENQWGALVGIGADTKTGSVPLELKFKTSHGEVTRSEPILVKEGQFPSETLKVQPRKVAPLVADLPKIKRDLEWLKKTYSVKTPHRYWDPPVILPVESIVTSVFGSKRVYNGIKQSSHNGTDLRAGVGTPIRCPITGRVALARNLFFTGNTIILDHGYGFFTIYAHLSKILVKEDLEVKKGGDLGLAGMTGRVSGPHLHWGVNLHGVKIDPLNLVSGLK